LAKVITHETNGQPCHHFLYWLGGLLIEKYQTFDGTWDVRAVQVTGYKKHLNRGASNATCREYLRIEINCTFAGSITARVPLFHLDGTDDVQDGKKVKRHLFQLGYETKIGDKQWLQIAVGGGGGAYSKTVLGVNLSFNLSPDRQINERGEVQK
jgi:hypothetical protein